MAIKDEKGNWLDGAGHAVPPQYIAKIDRDRDAMVERILKQVEAEHERLVKLKAKITGEIERYLTKAAKEAGLKENPGGNYTFTSFSGDKQVELKVAKFIEFDERLKFAKAKIDACLERWSEGANGNLKVIVYDAFKVDEKGKVDTKRILGLRKLKIPSKEKEWHEAMDLIAQAVTINGKKAYLHFRKRNFETKVWETVRLDFASL